MPRWDSWLAGVADVLGPLLLTVPPNIGSRKPRDLVSLLKLAWRNRGLNVRTTADVTRLMTMSIADLLDDWFESSSLADLAEPADLALLGVPDASLEQQLGLAAATGCRSAVIFGNAAEADRRRLAAIAACAGIELCGAGCMGFANVAYGLRRSRRTTWTPCRRQRGNPAVADGRKATTAWPRCCRQDNSVG